MKRLILALTFGAFAAGSASAQLRLTLDDAIQMALSENPTIKVADLDVERYDYVKKETRGNLLPSLSASGEYTRAIEKSTMRGGISRSAPTIPLPVRPASRCRSSRRQSIGR